MLSLMAGLLNIIPRHLQKRLPVSILRHQKFQLDFSSFSLHRKKLLSDQIRAKVVGLLSEMVPTDRSDKERCRDLIRSALRKYLVKLISREPYVLVSILDTQ